MLRRLLLASCVLSALSVPAMAEEFDADSDLRAVTVYSDRAALTRRAVVDIPAGAHTVVFKGLSPGMMQESLRAEGQADSKVIFGAVAARWVAGAELAAEREREIMEQIEKTGDQIAAAQGEKKALEAKQEFFLSLGKQAALRSNEEIAEINLKPEQWKGAADSVHAGLAETATALRTQDIALRTLNRQMQKLQQELAQVRTGQTNMYEVTVPVEAQSATELTIDLLYQVPGATWAPQYDARLDTKSGKLELVQYGAVTQNTGEDWDGIALTLSTAQPSRGASLPEPETQWLNLYTPEPQNARLMAKAARGMAMDSMAGAAMMAEAPAMEMASAVPMAAPVPVEAEFRTAQIDTGGFVSEYKIPGPSNVKADGSESKLMIGPFETESTTQIRIQPQVSAEAYLAAMMKLKGEAPVLPGMANLFRDGSFVGQMALPLLRPDEEQHLYFGVDDQMAVKRRVMKDEKSEAGVIARDQVIERHYINEIENLHSTAFDVVVLETVPVSQDEKIRSEIVKDKTTPGYKADTDNIKGLMSWSFKMEPKQKKDVNVGVKVSWPADAELEGM
jgi:uncharacterized protein (TIGR02231 family)